MESNLDERLNLRRIFGRGFKNPYNNGNEEVSSSEKAEIFVRIRCMKKAWEGVTKQFELRGMIYETSKMKKVSFEILEKCEKRF